MDVELEVLWRSVGWIFLGAGLAVLAVLEVGELSPDSALVVAAEDLDWGMWIWVGGMWMYGMWQVIWFDRIVVMLDAESVMTWNKMASITSNYIAFLI